MTIFEAVKTNVTPAMAARRYGITVSNRGTACCPFHNDRHPSLKFYEGHFYCFGCQTTGDVIDFTSRLFNITAQEAAQKLAADFGVPSGKPSVLKMLRAYQEQNKNEKICLQTLREYLHILSGWKTKYAPQTPDEEPDPRYVEACHMLECTQHMVDLLTKSPSEKRTELAEDMMKGNKITLLQERLQDIKKEDR